MDGYLRELLRFDPADRRKLLYGTFDEPEPITEKELLRIERYHVRADNDASRLVREVWRLRRALTTIRDQGQAALDSRGSLYGVVGNMVEAADAALTAGQPEEGDGNERVRRS